MNGKANVQNSIKRTQDWIPEVLFIYYTGNLH